MDKSTIIAKLREHEGELKAAGIGHLFLHGSTRCRGTTFAVSATGSAHRYDRVDVETVWNTVIDDLPPLRAGVLRALAPPPAN
jgi:hypothetical protein